MTNHAIRRLSPEVVNRIAAGEVVQRPVNVVKELIENAIDAGATEVSITSEHQLGVLRVSDNGSGIRKEDLPLLCERFSTSKLEKYEDLERIRSFGFRGEALASISCAAKRLVVVTMQPHSRCAWRCVYKDGKALLTPPAMCAGTKGTTISVEDLYQCQGTRGRIFAKTACEQYLAIVSVAAAYALHYANRGVGIICRRLGHCADVDVRHGASPVEAICACRGGVVARNIVTLACTAVIRTQDCSSDAATCLSAHAASCLSVDKESAEAEAGSTVTLKGFCSASNTTQVPAPGFLLFVNGRLVDHGGLKRIVGDVYSRVLPRGVKPFVYLSIDMDPATVDINVHPTKSRVNLLHEDQILTLVRNELKARVLNIEDVDGQGHSLHQVARMSMISPKHALVISTEPLPLNRPEAIVLTTPALNRGNGSNDGKLASASQVAVNSESAASGFTSGPLPPHFERANSIASLPSVGVTSDGLMLRPINHSRFVQGTTASCEISCGSNSMAPPRTSSLVRANPRDRPIEAFFSRLGCPRCGATATTSPGAFANVASCRAMMAGLPACVCGSRFGPLVFCETLCSYDSISGLLAGFRENADADFTLKLKQSTYVGMVDDYWLLAQHGNTLLLYDHRRLAYTLFYQLCIRRFGRTRSLDLTSNALNIRIALAAVAPSTDLAHDAANLLFSKAGLLSEYFQIRVQDPHLLALPELLPGHTPTPGALPSFLYDLATEVDWKREEPCFIDIAKVLARCYATFPCAISTVNLDGQSSLSLSLASQHLQQRRRLVADILRLCLFPAFRLLLMPPKGMAIEACLELTTQWRLFRVFERC
eukprot:CAMPEP_0198658548 /NCGR_PEP_ID=MMETSP1467-20131203/26121_1 /TAXON_ID=1462469 /ORGANISM="unid. sp., Strain CCMP2135" /LENGTH=823 /DNA_ID=CAMNT_0044394823 /DNA_START=1 /DNA_END=2472 /DNA_ORIENTATION=-